jgi:hypothetical protein
MSNRGQPGLWAVGTGMAAAAAAIGAATAHADDTSPLVVLGDAQSALIDANQVLGQIDVSGLTGDEAGWDRASPP